MKKLVTAASLALAGLSLSSTSALAARPYTNGDLLLGFRASGGVGAARDYVVNLGSASQFTSGDGSIPVLTSADNIVADLSSTGASGLFGTSWNTRADVQWGAVATDLAADPSNTLYATRARAATGPQAQAWSRRPSGSQSTTNSTLRAFISGYVNSDTNAVSVKGTIQPITAVNSYASFTSASTDFNFFSSVEGDFGAGTAGTVLDLFRIAPGANGSGSQHLGYFSINDSGEVAFNFDDLTLTPTLTAPATNAQSKSPVSVSFTLPETALPGTVKLAFSTGSPVSTLTLSAANETGAPHAFSFNPANPTANANIASGAAIPDGIYTVELSYQDSLGNAAASASSSDVLIDTKAPLIDTSAVVTTGYTNVGTLPDLRPVVSVSDLSGATLQQSPAPGSALPVGTLVLTFTATDALGQVSSANVSLDVAAANPITTLVVAKDGAVAGAGVPGSGIQAGAKFTTFGIPSINDAGTPAYVAKWAAPKIVTPATPAQSGTGIFVGNPAALVVKLGDPVPSIAGATFSAFKDPVLNADGRIAFLATIKGTGILPAENQVLVTNAFAGGALTVVARAGQPSGESDGSLIKSFTDISLQGDEVLYTTKLSGGTPLVVPANDTAAFAVTLAGSRRIVREGETYGATTVKSFRLLGAVSGSGNQTRAHSLGSAAFFIALADGKQALVDGDGTALTPFATTGQLIGSTTLPAATFKTLSTVAVDGSQAAALATLTAGVGGVLSADAKGIFLANGSAFEPVVRLSNPAPGVAGSVFSAVLDPLLADGAVAFGGTIKDTTTKASTPSIWWKPAAGPLGLVSKLNDSVPELPPGAKWKAYKSLVLAGGSKPSPIIYAQLLQGVGGVDATNDYGVWAVDQLGALRLIVREGDSIGGKAVKGIVINGPVPGSNGVTHSFNNARQLIYRAAFTDGSTGIVTTILP